MKRRRYLISGLVMSVTASVIAGVSVLGGTATAAPAGSTRQISSGGTTSFQAGALGADAGVQDPEFAGESESEGGGAVADGPTYVDRSLSHGPGNGGSVNAGPKAKSNPEVNLSFDGLNFRQQRLANGGNQFSVEPPDQGLCVGNGFVLETVNVVLRTFDTAGNALSGVTDQNTFYGYPPAIDRTTGVRGPFVTDPSCLYDPETGRFFHVVLTLDSFPNGAFTGKNHLDLAVSNTSNPTGTWTIYRIPVQDDGTDGTPNHNCSPGPGSGTATNPNACIGDYPHIGADRNGIYLTTNEYDLFGPNFKGAQIYAISKFALASGAPSVSVTQFDTSGPTLGGQPGFTVWPALTPGGQYSDDLGGTEYFLSSRAAEEATGVPGGGSASTTGLWALSNTSSLSSATPALTLRNAVLPSVLYAVPPKSEQKPGDIPLGTCVNDTTTTITSLGPPFVGCWKALFAVEPSHTEVESHLDSNDSRMQQVYYANGKVWGGLDTALVVNGVNKAGVAYFVVNPSLTGGVLSGSTVVQGYVALANNNLTYPTVGVLKSGRGIMSFTVVGNDYYPSVGYVSLDANIGAGPVHVSTVGAGPSDGFTSYKAFVGNPPRTRWGDYGASAVDGNGKSIWFATEYIAASCTFATYISAPFGACGGTRASLGNWATRITKATP